MKEVPRPSTRIAHLLRQGRSRAEVYGALSDQYPAALVHRSLADFAEPSRLAAYKSWTWVLVGLLTAIFVLKELAFVPGLSDPAFEQNPWFIPLLMAMGALIYGALILYVYGEERRPTGSSWF